MKKIIVLLVLVCGLIIFASTDWKSLYHKWFEGNVAEIQKEHPHSRDAAIMEMSGETDKVKK
jgi:hypothetical protein